MAIKKDFDLHYQFKLYMERCSVPDISKMPADQLTETRRAFFGACGQLLILMRDDVSELDEKGGGRDNAKYAGTGWSFLGK